MRVLSLFSGGGLGDYGLELAGMEIVGQVEIDDRHRKLLDLQRPWVPKWKDIREIKSDSLPEADIISGGFPCQPYSNAGRKRGAEDDRNLWPEMFRIIREKSPAFVLAENVPGIVSMYLDQVLDDLESHGYATLPFDIPACAFGAGHVRSRIWIIAYSESFHKRRLSERKTEKKYGLTIRNTFLGNSASEGFPDWAGGKVGQPSPLTEFERPVGEDVEDAKRIGWRRWNQKGREILECKGTQNKIKRSSTLARQKPGEKVREIERDFRGMAYGVSDRVHRLQMLGNGQHIQTVKWIGERIMEFASHDQP